MTPDSYDSYKKNILFTDSDSVMFSVQAGNDAFIELSSVPGVYSSDTFEILIGGANNAKSEIRSAPMGTIVVDVVSCYTLFYGNNVW